MVITLIVICQRRSAHLAAAILFYFIAFSNRSLLGFGIFIMAQSVGFASLMFPTLSSVSMTMVIHH